MRLKFALATITAVLAVSALGTASAAAATQAGSNCVGNTGSSGTDFTMIELASAPGNPLPATIPVSGVITKWTFSVIPIPPGMYSQTLKIFRSVGGNQYQVVGESAPGLLNGGLSTFSTRIPVRAGDLIGNNGSFSGEPLTIFCLTGNPADRVGIVLGSSPLNSTVSVVEEETELQVPITVFVEPDADNDGYGDETQDQCPQNASFQTACPLPVTLSSATLVRKGSVTVIVTPSATSTISVKGVAKLGKGKKATLNGGAQNLGPGLQGKFRLVFTKKLKTKLKELTPKQKLTLKVTVSGTNATGPATTSTLKVKLKGQGPKS